jgi:hypothetical protein
MDSSTVPHRKETRAATTELAPTAAAIWLLMAAWKDTAIPAANATKNNKGFMLHCRNGPALTKKVQDCSEMVQYRPTRLSAFRRAFPAVRRKAGAPGGVPS